MNLKQLASFILILSLYLVIPLLFAQTPRLLNYQGKLIQSDGTPISVEKTITFSIYPDSAGGTALWAEVQKVTVDNGVFNVLLGGVTPFPDTMFTGVGANYLGIKIGSNPEMQPRYRLGSVAYAIKANYADTALVARKLFADKFEIDGDWILAGENMYSAVNGNVGIGTTNPGTKLHIDGGSDASVSNVSGILMLGSETGKNLIMDDNEIMAKNVDSTSILHLQAQGGSFVVHGLQPAEQKFFISDSGYVGIGTAAPESKLQISDGAIMPDTGNTNIAGIYFPSNPGGGLGDEAFVRYYAEDGENTKLQIGINNDYDDDISFLQWGKEVLTIAQHNVSINGSLSKAAGSFKIDHPLDPTNKNLYHSFVESPDMKNIYDGVAILDNNGEAQVDLPAWFEALNRDFRYQLTCIGGFAQVYIAEEIANNRFKIAGGKPGLKISWQVTGIRKDAYAEKNRIPVEEDKPNQERGKYLYPKAFNLPESMGIHYEAQKEMEQQSEL